LSAVSAVKSSLGFCSPKKSSPALLESDDYPGGLMRQLSRQLINILPVAIAVALIVLALFLIRLATSMGDIHQPTMSSAALRSECYSISDDAMRAECLRQVAKAKDATTRLPVAR
jgi:hypothetical protein